MAVERFLEQVRFSLQRGGKRRLDRHEQQHEIQAMQAFEALVILAGQAFDVIAQGQYVLLERRLADHFVVRADILLIGGQADLRVDHHLLVAGQHDQHVGLEALTVRALEADLSLVFTALLQASVLQHPLKDQFAPVTLGFLALEGAGQVGGLVRQTQVQLL